VNGSEEKEAKNEIFLNSLPKGKKKTVGEAHRKN
jgi:hypothetical protein